MSCLNIRELQGYLEDPDALGLRSKVERHLVECEHCRGTFDRMAATNHRVNTWLSALASPLESDPVDVTGALERVLGHKEEAAAAAAMPAAPDHLAGLLSPATVEMPWYVSLFRGLRDAVWGEKLPPLEVTS